MEDEANTEIINEEPDKTTEQVMAETRLEIEKATEQERTSVKKKLFLQYFKKSLGIIGVAAQMADIERQTYYNWKEADPEFKKACDEILYTQPDAVEDKLIESISKNNTSSIHFYLARKHAAYKQKEEIEANIMHHTPYDGLTNDEIFERAETIRNRLLRRKKLDAGIFSGDGSSGEGGHNITEA